MADSGPVVQRPSTPAFQAGDRGFESRRGYHIASLLLALLPALAAADEAPTRETRRGPTELRDEHLFDQDRLTLPAFSTETLALGRWQVRASLLWLNSFSWIQDVPGEHPGDRRFLLDGETRTLDLSARYGVRPHFDVGLRVPVRWRGGGVLDGLIDTWHRIFNLPGGNRRDFLRDAFRVEGKTTAGRPFSWNDQTGTGLGNLEAEARWNFRDGGRDGWSATAAARVAVPTGSGPFAGDGPGLGLQAATAKRLSRTFDVFLGAGGTLQDDGPVRGILYEPLRGQVWAALEWRPWRRMSLVLETDAATRLVRNVDRYPGVHWMTSGSARIDVARAARLEIGITENIVSQLSTADFGFHLGLVWHP